MTKITVIILNWNKAELTLACVQSVLLAFQSIEDGPVAGRLVVVDNASDAADLDRLESGLVEAQDCTPRAELVVNSRNLGYAGGMNSGIRLVSHSHADYVWLLNNDTIVDPKAISALLALSRSQPQAAMLGSTIADQASEQVVAAGGHRYFPWLGLSRPRLAGRSLSTIEEPKSLTKMDYIDGAALWLNGHFLRRIGELPNDHFLYFEELSLAQCLAEGESIAWCPNALVYHVQGGSSPTPALRARGTYHAALSAFNYTRQYYPICLPTVVFARLIGITLRSIALCQPKLLAAVFIALKDFMMGKKARYDEP
ncbi:glycosyl transferase, group 2 family [marine gamma proteobacterium HTCC2148]|nr:glycosyl transferase, group 2 family [marine gamma proteobacterium HTCC2148]